jgi:dienelactone hydrolase
VSKKGNATMLQPYASDPPLPVPRRLRAALLGTALALSAQFGLAAAEPEMPAVLPANVEPFLQGAVRGILVFPLVPPAGAVLILQDATGPDGRTTPYVNQLLGAGLAALDIFEHDGDAPAVEAAATSLAERFAPARIGVLSFGAGAAIAASLHPIAARALLYPGCTEHLSHSLAAAAGSLLLAHGGRDAANPTHDCAAAAASLGATGRPVRHLVYERASYAWDHPALGMEGRFLLPRPDGKGHVEVLPWPALGVMSASEVASFFATSLAP